MPVPRDTSPDAERVLIEGYRRMSLTEKLERVAALRDAGLDLGGNEGS